MANPNKVWGLTTIVANGVTLETEGKGTLQVGGPVRSPVQGDNTAGFFSTEIKESEVECTVLVTAGLSLVALQAIEDATLVHICDTGQVYVIQHAFVSDAVSASEGKAKVKFNGPPAEEELA